MTNHKVNSNIQLAELMSEHGIESFSIDKEQYPAIVILDDDKFVTLVSYSEFEPAEWMGDVQRVLEWHDSTMEKGITSNDYDALMKARSKLSRCIEWLGLLKAETANAYVKAGYDRRRKRDNLKIIYMQGSSSVSMAESKARVETESYDNEHAQSLKDKIKTETLYDTVKETLNAMAGEIRTLENELKTLNYQQ